MEETSNSTLMIEQKMSLPNPFDNTPDFTNQNDRILLDNINESMPLTDTSSKKPNFPSFYPIVYHSIGLEIPQKYSFITRLCYNGMRSFTMALALSVIAEFFSGSIDSLMIVMWREIVLSLFIFFICPAALCYGQYYPLYCAIRDEKPNPTLTPFQFFTIFVFFFLLIGIPGTGIIGIGYLIVSFRCGSLVNKIFSIIITIWHLFNFIIQFMLLFLITPINSTTMARNP